MDPVEPSRRITDIREYRPAFIGMVLLVCTPFLVLGSADVYGALATVLLMALWLVLFALGCFWFMRNPPLVLAAAVVSMVGWLVVVLFAL